jgi:hypothetical protein
VAVACALVILVPEVMDSRPGCQRLLAWRQAHAASLPATLAELEAYPNDYRRVIFGGFPAEVKVRLVREHLQAWRGRAESAAQRDAIDRMLAVVDLKLYGDVSGSSAELAAAEEAVKTAFGSRALLITRRVGRPEIRTPVFGQARHVQMVEWLRGGMVAIANPGDCNCVDGDCAEGWGCVSGGCEGYDFPACGLYYREYCSGICGGNGGKPM